MALMPVSKFPEALTLFIGDTKQVSLLPSSNSRYLLLSTFVRICPYDKAYSNFLKSVPSPPEHKSVDGLSSMEGEQVINWYNKQMKDEYEENNPATNKTSWSKQAQQMVLGDPHTFYVMSEVCRNIGGNGLIGTVPTLDRRQ
jgi:hypothetical protein